MNEAEMFGTINPAIPMRHLLFTIDFTEKTLTGLCLAICVFLQLVKYD